MILITISQAMKINETSMFLFCILITTLLSTSCNKAGNNIEINLYNSTSSVISNLHISYDSAKTNIEIAKLQPNKSTNILITPSKISGENTLRMYFVDKNNITHTNVLIGYFEKNYKISISVNIQKITENNILIMKITNSLLDLTSAGQY